MSKLLIKEINTGKEFEFTLSARNTRIGRTPEENDLILDDKRVSRQHAILQQSGASYILTDLKSANGTLVDGKKVDEFILSDGDTISICNYLLKFSDQNEKIPIDCEYDDRSLGSVLLERTPEQVLSDLPQKGSPSSSLTLSTTVTGATVDTLLKKAETLSHLYELNHLLKSVFSLEDIFRRVSEMLFELTPSDRFVALLRDSEQGELSPLVIEYRQERPSYPSKKLVISKTVVERVVENKVALLSKEAQTDQRLSEALSIVTQQVQSVMCAPLLVKDGVAGVIYVDCLQPLKMFEADDLDLLNALAVETSLAVDNVMTHDQLLEARLEQDRWQQDLRRAHEIQRAMLPEGHFSTHHIEISGYCQPAAFVGGDYYDYLALQEDRLGIILADVMGHGFYSALFVAMAKSCLHTQANIDLTPNAVMQAMNRILFKSVQSGTLMSACYLLIDFRNKTLTYTNAGHPYPYHYCKSNDRLDSLVSTDMILGIPGFEDNSFSTQQRNWGKGDLIVLFSDGIPEARNPAKEQFGEARLETVILRNKNKSADQIKTSILEALSEYRHDTLQDDDVTLVVAKAL